MGDVMRHVSDTLTSLPRKPRGHRSRVSPEKKRFAKDLRNNPTRAYDILWQRLRRSQLGVRFRRRAILLGWVPDFWCPAARVVVEIDYASDKSRELDHRRRDAILARNAMHVIRVPAERVYTEPDQVVREIELVISGVPFVPHNRSLERSRIR